MLSPLTSSLVKVGSTRTKGPRDISQTNRGDLGPKLPQESYQASAQRAHPKIQDPLQPSRSAENPSKPQEDSAPKLLTSFEQATPPTNLDPEKRFDAHEIRKAQAIAKDAGTRVLTLVGGDSVFQVRVHGSKRNELSNINKHLQSLSAQDPHGLIVRHLKDIYLCDTLGKSRNGQTSLQGANFKESDSQNSILLSRVTEQKSDSKILENPNYLRRLLYHEIGHSVDERYQISTGHPLFGKGDSPESFVTPYASTNPKEDFAETFREYFEAATELNEATPGEVLQLTSFGRPGEVKQKLSSLTQDINPEREAHRISVLLLAECGKGPREVVESYSRDKQFKTAWDERSRNENPQLPEAAMSTHMAGMAKLFNPDDA